MKPITILGGGLAGLSLARGLARRGVPVTLWEKGNYPRHKVCGEFITGLDAATLRTLALEPILGDAQPLRHTAWFLRDRFLFRRELPQAARGISRWQLDLRLADAASAAGVDLRTDAGIVRESEFDSEGCIWSHGAPRKRGGGASWIGLKAHVRGLTPHADLELHLGRGAYVGVSPVEDGWLNVGMLLHGDACPPSARRRLEDALAAVGLASLGDRLRAAEVNEASRSAIAGFTLGHPRQASHALVLGDALGMIAPFTGHGMAMALQSAAAMLGPLHEFALGGLDWEGVRAAHRSLVDLRRRRVEWSRRLHPLLLRPSPQRLAARVAPLSFFPWRQLYRLTHT